MTLIEVRARAVGGGIVGINETAVKTIGRIVDRVTPSVGELRLQTPDVATD